MTGKLTSQPEKPDLSEAGSNPCQEQSKSAWAGKEEDGLAQTGHEVNGLAQAKQEWDGVGWSESVWGGSEWARTKCNRLSPREMDELDQAGPDQNQELSW